MNEQQDRAAWTTWFEIPATDMDRAIAFYQEIFDIDIQKTIFGPFEMGVFPHSSQGGCALCKHETHTPSKEGIVVYLNANPNLQPMLDKVESAGGQIVSEKTSIGEHGFMAVFIDSEGNRLALHSEQ